MNLEQIQDFRNGGSLYGLLRVVPFSGGRVGGGEGEGGGGVQPWVSTVKTF